MERLSELLILGYAGNTTQEQVVKAALVKQILNFTIKIKSS